MARRTVFVCDQDEDARVVIRTFLTARGYEVGEMSTGQDLLGSVVHARPDAILIDLFMPDLNGWELLARLKSDPATASIPIIITSVFSQEETGVSLRELSGWIQKPFSEVALMDAWEKAISK